MKKIPVILATAALLMVGCSNSKSSDPNAKYKVSKAQYEASYVNLGCLLNINASYEVQIRNTEVPVDITIQADCLENNKKIDIVNTPENETCENTFFDITAKESLFDYQVYMREKYAGADGWTSWIKSEKYEDVEFNSITSMLSYQMFLYIVDFEDVKFSEEQKKYVVDTAQITIDIIVYELTDVKIGFEDKQLVEFEYNIRNPESDNAANISFTRTSVGDVSLTTPVVE